MEDRKCPLCREKIPPSKEMVTQLKSWRSAKSKLEAQGDFSSENYTWVISQMEKLEREIGDGKETLDYSDDSKCVVLPTNIHLAANTNDIQKILDWLGPPPVDKQRINARIPDYLNYTLVHCAVLCKNSDLLSILLQLGADVDPVAANGGTPLVGSVASPEYYAQARLLLEWGAEISMYTRKIKDEFIEKALKNGNSNLVNLLESEFGGRRCEIINLPNHPDLIGNTCVVEKYLADKGRYKVVFEASKEMGLVGPENLKRRDRTPEDCGYYITYKNGRTTRHDIHSKEECEAFVASLAEEDSKAEARAEQAEAEAQAEQAEAEARAEEAAASLLAELSIESSADSDRKSQGG